MNSDRSIEELLEVFGISNLSNLGSDVIVKYFDDISVKEVMKLCRVNKQFNTVCEKDSMWRRKVERDYGIKRKYGKTWKDTAQFLFEYNMINLNQEWINGKTYKELFDESLESKSDNYFKDLYDQHNLLKIIFPFYVKDIRTAKLAILDPETTTDLWIQQGGGLNGLVTKEDENTVLKEFNSEFDNILEDEVKLRKQTAGMTREFAVITSASAEIRGTHSEYSIGLSTAAGENMHIINTTGNILYVHITPEKEMKIKELTKFVDPNLYILTYSVMSLYSLWVLDVWREN
uniref:F-box domain-containing protein n=1 Tax=Pithovirus LCPAC401 TaxID=2506595 RepID=A0A481ZA73_9VIRU|nr:MAG: uncharacterized protein LCPAC401_04560 [Pithovirus LCPAC401]